LFEKRINEQWGSRPEGRGRYETLISKKLFVVRPHCRFLGDKGPAKEDIPNMPDNFEEWLQAAHDVIHIWFGGVIDGNLIAEFNK